jgi:hypothetical protein
LDGLPGIGAGLSGVGEVNEAIRTALLDRPDNLEKPVFFGSILNTLN